MFWCVGLLILGVLVALVICVLADWCIGLSSFADASVYLCMCLLACWFIWTLVCLFIGVCVYWFICGVVRWLIWVIGLLVNSFICFVGVFVYWSMVYWCNCVLVYWCVCLFAYCLIVLLVD